MNKKIFKFEQIFEKYKYENIKLVIICDYSSHSEKDTPDFLKEAAEKEGIETYILDLAGALIEDLDDKKGNFKVYNKGDKKGFKINKNDTVIISRRGVLKNTYTRAIQSLLEEKGFFVINPLNSLEICENKYITIERLESAGLPVPKTALIPDSSFIDSALEKLGNKFPLVLKTLSGTKGIGVSLIESEQSLRSVLQTLWKFSDVEVLVQEYIESDYDLRVHVLNKSIEQKEKTGDETRVIGYMKRNKVEDDFRTNVSLGGKAEKTEISDEVAEIAKKAARAVGCYWCGVDIIIDKKTKKPYVLEVNASAGTKGIQKVAGKKIIKDIINFIKDKSNWASKNLEVGYREVITIDGIGDFIAKFDTGNGSKASSLHADSFEIKGDMVEWKLGKKKFKHKIVDYSTPQIGFDEDKRPVILLDVVFDGRHFKDIPFALTTRDNKSTPVLVNRKLMRQLNVCVNPKRTFLVTNFDGYKIKKTKEDIKKAIKFDEDED